MFSHFVVPCQASHTRNKFGPKVMLKTLATKLCNRRAYLMLAQSLCQGTRDLFFSKDALSEKIRTDSCPLKPFLAAEVAFACKLKRN